MLANRSSSSTFHHHINLINMQAEFLAHVLCDGANFSPQLLLGLLLSLQFLLVLGCDAVDLLLLLLLQCLYGLVEAAPVALGFLLTLNMMRNQRDGS